MAENGDHQNKEVDQIDQNHQDLVNEDDNYPRLRGDTLNAANDDDDSASGLFIRDSASPAPSIMPPNRLQLMLARQREMAQNLLSRQQATSPKDSVAGDEPASDHDATEKAPSTVGAATTTTLRRPFKDKAAIDFAAAKKKYDRKKRAGTLTHAEEIEFLVKQNAEEARLRKIQLDKEYDEMPSEDEEADEEQGEDATTHAPAFSALMSEEEPSEAEPKTKKRGRPRKKAAAANDDEVADAMPAPKKKRASKKAARTEADDVSDVPERFRKKQESGGKKKSSPAANKKKTPAKNRREGPQMTNTTSLMGNDVFADTARTQHLRSQPRLGAERRKDKAVTNLMVSIADEDRRAAKQDKKALLAATKDFTGTGSCFPGEDGNWAVKGMKTTLKHYQVLGTAFMRRRENAEHEPRGGILADQMGLGKTIMMLANIVNGKPTKKDTKQRCTLIVAAPALVSQWMHEIENHTQSQRENKKHGIGNVLQFRAGHRIESNNTEAVLSEADIVLTTYHEVAKSYPKANIPTNLVTAKQKDDWWKEYYEQEKGILHRVNWFRVVLDEAQAIKNHRGHTSMACRALMSKHNWAITGTPILNTIKEFYPYLKFLREPNTGSFKIFKENFCTPDDPTGVERLNALLRVVMIRRTHLDTLFEARLLDLPPPTERTLWLEFNDVERQVYEIVKKRFIARINTIAKQDGLQKQYSHIWTMILRLRQLTNHILLIQGTIMDLLEREDFERLNKITETEDLDEYDEHCEDLLRHLRNTLANSKNVKTIEGGLQGAVISEAETVPVDSIGYDADDRAALGGRHGLSFRFRKYLENLQQSDAWADIEQRTLCSGCRQPPEDPQVTSCFHIYCKVCLNELQHYAARSGHDQARCSECGQAYTSTQPCVVGITRSESRVSMTPDPGSQGGGDGKKKKKSKKNEANNDGRDWIGLDGQVCPSAKTQALKAQILNWLAEDATAKIIIYTQFLPCVRILAKICKTEGWNFCKYEGTMSHESRRKAIEEFADESKGKQIMIASLKCGGLGLNLTMASRVICLDPWWNNGVEQQAFCRVFRIGQTRETKMTRLVVKNTIDGAMMAMKQRKQIEIDEVMDGRQEKKFDYEELMRLFGPVGQDEEGKPFILAEKTSEDGEEGDRVVEHDEEDEEMEMGNEE